MTRWSSADLEHNAKAQIRRNEAPPREEPAPAAPSPPPAPERGTESKNARYYPSTTKTPDGLCMARLVGYTPEQLEEVFAFTRAQHGARPY